MIFALRTTKNIRLAAALLTTAAAAALTGCHEEETFAPNEPAAAVSAILTAEYTDTPSDYVAPDAPDDGARLHINSVGPLRQVFNDSNHVHMEAARAVGIKPIRDDGDILGCSRPLVHIAACEDFHVDPLSHSFPYLVPEAAGLLHDIGAAFNDSLRARGGGAYRLKVTSVLRTPATVKKLRRVNRNATEESTHQYGTTFDISYSKFICDDPSQPHRTFEDLKNLLAEVLRDMRDNGRCFVKYEYKQSCFHITVRN